MENKVVIEVECEMGSNVTQVDGILAKLRLKSTTDNRLVILAVLSAALEHTAREAIVEARNSKVGAN